MLLLFRCGVHIFGYQSFVRWETVLCKAVAHPLILLVVCFGAQAFYILMRSNLLNFPFLGVLLYMTFVSKLGSRKYVQVTKIFSYVYFIKALWISL